MYQLIPYGANFDEFLPIWSKFYNPEISLAVVCIYKAD